jgi:hypothetical protein
MAGKTKPSSSTMAKARALAATTMDTACSIYTPTSVDDGYADVPSYGLREVATCRITKLDEKEITDEMRARKAQHFVVALPAYCEIRAGERITTTWKPDGSATENLTLEVVETNTPRQTEQIVIEAIAFQVK